MTAEKGELTMTVYEAEVVRREYRYVTVTVEAATLEGAQEAVQAMVDDGDVDFTRARMYDGDVEEEVLEVRHLAGSKEN